MCFSVLFYCIVVFYCIVYCIVTTEEDHRSVVEMFGEKRQALC